MQLSRTTGVLAVAGFLGFAAITGQAGSQEQGPPMPKPGPEHEVFKEDVGTWDAKVEIIPMPGMEPMVSSGVETNTLGCGGLCLINDFKGETAPGQTFHGHGIGTWDPQKKKYVGSWTDSMSSGLAISEGTWDAKARKGTATMTTTDPTGKTVTMRMVSESPTPTTRTMTTYTAGPDGKEFVSMRITYTKRK